MNLQLILRAACVAVLALAIIGEEAATSKGSAIPFSSEVPKMLEILINSLYTNRNVFLREIISNGSDALDKVRIEYLTNPKEPKNDSGEPAKLEMRIAVEKDKRQITFSDGGVGMTKEELAKNLGTLGASGTKRFLEASKQDAPLIGQFGVGFYSVFLVAERVRVASKSDSSDTQWVWESTGDGTFFIYEDPRGNTLGRGTELTLELKLDANEYLDTDKLKEIVHKYSEFIHFPIYMEVTKTETKRKPKAEESEEDSRREYAQDELEEVSRTEWELVNENEPIWTRNPSEITEDEYNKFYKALTKDYNDPMFYTHFKAMGEVEFKSILFIPIQAPHNIFETTAQAVQNNIQLYVRRVFITDDFKDLLPRYLSFIKGIVDSDDLPLNVSREVLQESRILKVIKKKLVRKALVMISDIAEFDRHFEDGPKDKSDDEQADAKESSGNKKLKVPTYDLFWREYGKNIRLGMIEDSANRARLIKLLRYQSSKSDGKLISLEDYHANMKPNQQGIYYLTGDSVERIMQSPYFEDAVARDIEVLFMTDAIDEYVVGHITDYADKKLINLAKEGPKVDEGKREKAIENLRKEKYAPFLDWYKNLLGENVSKVVLSKRKTSEPLIVVARQHDLSARMVRLMRGQALADKRDPEQERQLKSQRVLEVNYLHPLIDELYKRVKADANDTVAADIALVLFDSANLQSDFDVDDITRFTKRINRLVRQSVDIDPNAPLIEEDLSEYAVPAEADEEEAKDDDDGGDDAAKEEL